MIVIVMILIILYLFINNVKLKDKYRDLQRRYDARKTLLFHMAYANTMYGAEIKN